MLLFCIKGQLRYDNNWSDCLNGQMQLKWFVSRTTQCDNWENGKGFSPNYCNCERWRWTEFRGRWWLECVSGHQDQGIISRAHWMAEEKGQDRDKAHGIVCVSGFIRAAHVAHLAGFTRLSLLIIHGWYWGASSSSLVSYVYLSVSVRKALSAHDLRPANDPSSIDD